MLASRGQQPARDKSQGAQQHEPTVIVENAQPDFGAAAHTNPSQAAESATTAPAQPDFGRSRETSRAAAEAAIREAEQREQREAAARTERLASAASSVQQRGVVNSKLVRKQKVVLLLKELVKAVDGESETKAILLHAFQSGGHQGFDHVWQGKVLVHILKGYGFTLGNLGAALQEFASDKEVSRLLYKYNQGMKSFKTGIQSARREKP